MRNGGTLNWHAAVVLLCQVEPITEFRTLRIPAVQSNLVTSAALWWVREIHHVIWTELLDEDLLEKIAAVETVARSRYTTSVLVCRGLND